MIFIDSLPDLQFMGIFLLILAVSFILQWFLNRRKK